MTKTMKWNLAAAMVFLSLSNNVWAQEPDWENMSYTEHSDFQAVDANGFGTFPVIAPVKMRGVILHLPGDMLPGAPGATPYLGGMWQTYIQAVNIEVGEDDFGGTALWMGQNIGKIVGNHPAGSYTNSQWLAELDRLRYDTATSHRFRPGDLVEIRARAPGMSFRGKTNINEKHINDPIMDFDIVLLQADYGLPAPSVITLSDVKDSADNFLFDQTRATGCEHYQGRLVQFNSVSFVSTDNWGPDTDLMITDGAGRTFPVKLGLGSGFTNYPAPTGVFDIVGIVDQEDFNSDDGNKDGYRLWVMDYDGVEFVVPVGPNVTNAVSRRTHDMTPTPTDFDIDVTLSDSVESREDGPYRVIVTFDSALTGTGISGQAQVSDVSLSSGSVDAVAISGNQLTVDMSGVDDAFRLVISFPGIASSGDGTSVVDSLYFGVLEGDVRIDGVINAADRVDVRNQVGLVVTVDNFRCDVDASGEINARDRVLVRNNIGQGIAD